MRKINYIQVNMKIRFPGGVYHIHAIDRSFNTGHVWVRATCFDTRDSFSLTEQDLLDGLARGDLVLIENEGCQHQFKEYVGFTSRYNYCVKCDEKEKV